MLLTIADLGVGERARVVSCGDDGDDAELPRRLGSLGLIPGTSFLVKRFAPLGDPVEIHFRGFRLALRPAEAMAVKVERT